MAAGLPDRIWRLEPELLARDGALSATFHGRDLFAPAAARLCIGDEVAEFAKPGMSMNGLEPVVEVSEDRVSGEVLWVDHFGNAITAIDEASVLAVGPKPQIRVGSLRLQGLHRTFGDVESLTPLAYIGSGGTLELAVRDGDLRERFGVDRGARVEVRAGGNR
jgi:S-adenosylmethionine hydrolase